VLFLWREENRRTGRKTLGASGEPTTNSTHMPTTGTRVTEVGGE